MSPRPAAGRLGNDDHPGLGRALEACGKVRRIAHHRLLLCRPFADKVADDHKAGGDADPSRHGLACGLGQSADRCYHCEPCPNRALGLVLVRPGPAEIGEHAIAHQLGGEASPLADLARHGILIGPQDIAHLLGIEPSDSAVEPTRSTNITVSWRRSAVGVGAAAAGVGEGAGHRAEGRDRL